MKNLKPVLLTLLVLVFAVSGSSQLKFGGRVVEVIDGKTVVIDMESRQLTAVLQYIEIPEKEQPLYWTVRTHLEKLVLGKTVEFKPQGIGSAQTFGQLYVGGMDIAQQMLRDGAAWHIGLEKSGQNEMESSVYKQYQEQAKSEKRGVWGVENLKPAWQFRAERLENDRRRERALSEKPRPISFAPASNQSVSTKTLANRRPGYWGDKNPVLKNIGALLNGYNARSRTGYLSTSLLGISEMDKEKENEQQKTAVDITYFYKEDDKKGRTGTFIISLVSLSREWRFLKVNDLILVANEKATVIGKPKRTTFKDGDMLGEKLTYEVSRSSLEKFANSDDVVLKVGEYMIRPRYGYQLLVYNMLQIAG